jgi:hypothetical protein
MSDTSVRPITSRLMVATAVLALALLPAACDKETTAPTMVVAGNTTLATSPTVAAAVAGTTFNFPAGAAAIAPSLAGQNLALTFTSGTAATMAFTNAAGVSTGNVTVAVSYGSCIFAVTSSNFPAGHSLALGQTVTVNPCNLSVATTGAVANGVATSRSVALLLGAAASAGSSVIVAVTAGGALTLNGANVGTVTLTPVSG